MQSESKDILVAPICYPFIATQATVRTISFDINLECGALGSFRVPLDS